MNIWKCRVDFRADFVDNEAKFRKCFAYTAQTACDKNGYVLDATLNPGNVHDSIAFDELYGRLCEAFPEMKYAVADAGCKTPWIAKRVIDDGKIRFFSTSVRWAKQDFQTL